MATFKELNAYYDILKKAFDSNNESYYFNNDRSHNATVLRFMFDNSSNICMYCGELSVLRNGFYSHFENMEDAEKVKGALIDSFTHFLNCNGTSLSIVLENYRDFGFKDLICKEVFEKKMKEGKLLLYRLHDDFSFKSDINHFSFSDSNIVRFEEDKDQHSAICVFHNKRYLDSMKKNFGILSDMAVRIY